MTTLRGVTNLYMECDVEGTYNWLAALLFAKASNESTDRGSVSQDNVLQKVDIVCDDIRSAYMLGDFLCRRSIIINQPLCD